MGGVAASANIITTTLPHNNEPRGLTVSSLTSLSINPTPAVSFNIQVPSRTSQVLHKSDMFAVNVLPCTTDSIKLCQAFGGALGRHYNPFEHLKHLFDYSSGIPIITTATSVLHCERKQVFRVQDHEIWVATVLGVDNYDDHSKGNLIYQNRAFHSLGDKQDD